MEITLEKAPDDYIKKLYGIETVLYRQVNQAELQEILKANRWDLCPRDIDIFVPHLSDDGQIVEVV